MQKTLFYKIWAVPNLTCHIILISTLSALKVFVSSCHHFEPPVRFKYPYSSKASYITSTSNLEDFDPDKNKGWKTEKQFLKNEPLDKYKF